VIVIRHQLLNNAHQPCSTERDFCIAVYFTSGTIMFQLRRSTNSHKKKSLQQQQQQQQQSAPLADRKLNVKPLQTSATQLQQVMPLLLEVDIG